MCFFQHYMLCRILLLLLRLTLRHLLFRYLITQIKAISTVITSTIIIIIVVMTIHVNETISGVRVRDRSTCGGRCLHRNSVIIVITYDVEIVIVVMVLIGHQVKSLR